MKFAAILVCFMVFGCAQSLDDSRNAQILRYDSSNSATGEYRFSIETSDGKTHQEQGHLKNAGTEQEGIAVQGSFSYVGDDGVTYTINYTADENGFQAEGAHLPVAPQH